MKIFVINLDRDVERMAILRRRMEDLALEYERFSAVYAKALPQKEKNAAVRRFRWRCAVGRRPFDGEIGCALSHYSIFRKMIAENLPMVCILEDDVVIDERIRLVLENLEKALNPVRPQVALLSNHSDPVGQGPQDGDCGFHSLPDDRTFELRPTGWDLCTEGYVITRAGAEALLKANYPLVVPCDAWPCFARRKVIELYHAFPTACSQDKRGFLSTTAVGGFVTEDLSWFGRIVHKLGRASGIVIDRFLCMFE